MTPEDFLSSRYDDYFRAINVYSDTASKYTPYNAGLLTRQQYKTIVTTFPLFPYIINSWQAQVGQNDSSVIISTSEDLSERYRRQKELLQKRVYDFLYSKLEYKKVELETVSLIAREGNAVWLINEQGKLIVESIFRFNVYWDNQNKIARYAYLVDGAEKAGMTNLNDGKELIHFKDPLFTDFPVAPSRLDAVYSSVLLEHHGIKASTNLMSKGMIGTILFKLGEKGNQKALDQTKDSDGKTWLQRQMEKLQDMFGGSKKAGRAGIIPDLEQIFEIGKSNRDTQFRELITDITPTRLAWGYSMTPTDLGVGGATTYNNVGSFNQALYDKIGRSMEILFDRARNNWLLPIFGFNTNSNFYIKYNQPEDPNRLAEVKQWLEDYKVGIITVNEYRDMRGLEPLPNGDLNYLELSRGQSNIIDQEITDNQIQANNSFFSSALVEYSEKTPITRAIESKDGVKFEKRWEKAITKQVNTFLDSFSKLKDEDLKNYEVKLPKIETFYNFKTCKNDMLQFAGMTLDELKKDKRLKFKAEFFDNEYPKAVLDSIDLYVESLLKGDDSSDYLFPTIDVETASQLTNVTKNNASLGVVDLAKKIEELLPSFASDRAELIAQTAIAEAVEGTRETMYKDNFPKGKKSWQTAKDERVRPTHKENEKEGKIGINQTFSNGFQRSGSEPRCRCTTLYYPD